MRRDRAETIPVARQGVWHARGSCATADGFTPAVLRGHRRGDSVAPRVGEGRNTMVKRGRCASWCLSPLMVEMALQENRGAEVRVYYPHDGNPDIEARLMFKDHDGRMGATSCARERMD